jgi:hypothetical protein
VAGGRGGRRILGWPGWGLVAVLVMQAGLSLRLVGLDTAFKDEALYLWAGHREWAHWLHGAAVPPFAAYFSGAPVIYPPLGAVADSAGGLAGARVLSLVFMLAATVLLWAAAGRLFGRRTGFFAAALFAVSGPILHLGAFATYDAMSVFLVALSVWLVVAAGERRDAAGWVIAAGAALALGNAAAYSSVLMDPVVVAVALLVAFPRPGGKAAAARCVLLVTVVVVLLGAGLLAGGSYYARGVEATTLARVPGSASAVAALADSGRWIGVIFALAVCGAAASWARRESAARTLLLAVLAAAAVLGPVEQARLHTLASLDKHVGLGAWFAAVAAGYAVDRFIAAAAPGRARAVTGGACVVALAFPVVLGAGQARAFSTDWPDAGSFLAIFGPLADHGSGRLLVEDPSIGEYYLRAGTQWQRWSSTRNIVLPSGASTGGPSASAGVTGGGNSGVFDQFITQGYFSYIALNFADTTALDKRLRAGLRRNHHYKIIDVVPYGPDGTYVIWKYTPRAAPQPGYIPRITPAPRHPAPHHKDHHTPTHRNHP